MRLQEYRKTAGMDQRDLADELGIAVQTVSSWETGARRPNIDMLIRLTEIFGCTADELLGIDRSQRDGETNDASDAETQIIGEELSGEDAKRPEQEQEKPRTREEVIAVRMSEALADARKRQEA